MKFNKDYSCILHENPPQELLNDFLLAKKAIIAYQVLSDWPCNMMQFLNNILPHLQRMKLKTSGDNNRYRYYLQFSTFVAQISICKILKEIQNPFSCADVNFWKTSWSIVNIIDKLDMEIEFRENQYKDFHKLLEKGCRRMGILPSFFDYGVLTRIGIVLAGAIIWYTMSGIGGIDSFIFGGFNGAILAGAHYLYTKK